MLDRWKEYRRRQRAALRESNRPSGLAPGQVTDVDEQLARDLLTSVLPPTEGATETAGETAGETPSEPGPAQGGGKRFGAAGRPLNRQSPFYVGFVGAFGVIIALGLWHLLGRLSTVLTLIVVAFFLTLAL